MTAIVITVQFVESKICIACQKEQENQIIGYNEIDSLCQLNSLSMPQVHIISTGF